MFEAIEIAWNDPISFIILLKAFRHHNNRCHSSVTWKYSYRGEKKVQCPWPYMCVFVSILLWETAKALSARGTRNTCASKSKFLVLASDFDSWKWKHSSVNVVCCFLCSLGSFCYDVLSGFYTYFVHVPIIAAGGTWKKQCWRRTPLSTYLECKTTAAVLLLFVYVLMGLC